MSEYCIAKIKVVSGRKYLDDSTNKTELVIDTGFEKFNSIVEVKKNFLFKMGELDENNKYSDDFITRYFKQFSKQFKIIKL